MIKRALFILLTLLAAAQSRALTTNEINAAHAQVKARYLQFLQGTPTTFDGALGDEAETTFLNKVTYGITQAQAFDFSQGSNVLFEAREPVPNDGSMNAAILAEKDVYYTFLQQDLPALAYGYTVNHPDNPYYMDTAIRDLYFESLQYFESRGIKPKMTFHSNDWRWNNNPPTDDGTPSGTVVAANLYLFELRMGSYCQSVLMMEDHVPAQYAATFSNAVETVKFLKFLGYSSGHVYYWLPYTGMPTGYEHWVQSDALQMYPDTTFVATLLETDVQKRHDGLLDAQQVFSDTLKPISGWADTIKPDFTGYHHRGPVGNSYTGNFMPFGAHGIYALQDTDFAVDAASVASLRETLLVNRLHSQPFAIPHGMRMRWPEDEGILKNGDALGAFVIYGSTLGLDDPAISKAFKRLWDTGDLNTDCAFAGGRGKIIRGLYMVDMIKQLESEPGLVAEPDPSGFWMKPYAGLALHRRDNWMAAVKGYSKYVWDFESLSAENEYGHYLSHGMLTIFKGDTSSAELDSGYNTKAGWDWYRQPGATAVHFELYQQQTSDNWNMSPESFMGAVSMDGENGVFGMKLNDAEINVNTVANGSSAVDIPINLKAHKSVFFMDDLIVLLGTDISGGDGAHNVETTLFQRYRSSTIQKMKKNGVTFNDGSEIIGTHTSMTLADHTGNGYYIPDAFGMKLFQGTQNSYRQNGSTASSGKYSTVVFDHGIVPADGSYEAAILVDGEAEIATLAASPTNYYQVQRMDSHVHQVLFPGAGNTTAYVFYDAVTNEAFVAEVDTPCIIVTKPDLTGWKINFANPELGIVPGSQTVDWGYASDNQFMASTLQQVEVRVMGLWQLSAASTQNVSLVRYEGGDTVLQFDGKDGVEVAAGLEPYGATESSVLIFDQVAFSEKFEGYVSGAAMVTGTNHWSELNHNPGNGVTISVQTDTGNAFSQGTANKYLDYEDLGGSGSWLVAENAIDWDVVRLSFDFLETSAGNAGGHLAVRLGFDDVVYGDEEAIGGVRPVEGILLPSGAYALNTAHHADLYFNETLLEINYIDPNGSTNVLGSGKMDVWLNGMNTADDVANDRNLASSVATIRSVRFESYSTPQNEVWFDNLEIAIATSLSPDSRYRVWAADYKLVGGDAEMLANPDEDALNNLVEYALGGVPTNGADAANIYPMLGNPVGSGIDFVYQRRTDHAARGLDYTVELSTNLVANAWTNGGYTVTGTVSSVPGFESVTNVVPTDVFSEQFIRLRIGLGE